jgi:hypothetical protein
VIASEHVANAILLGTAVQYRHAGAPLKAGREYPVYQARHQPALCRVAILTSTVQPAGPISLRDARREGHRSVTAAKSDWVRRHDAKWIAAQLGKPDEPTLAARFDQRHAQRIIQLVTLSVVRDEPRFLASQFDILHGKTSRGEYTTQRGKAIDELEVVPDAVAEQYAKAAEAQGVEQRDRFRNDRQDQARRSEWKRRPLRRKAA